MNTQLKCAGSEYFVSSSIQSYMFDLVVFMSILEY